MVEFCVFAFEIHVALPQVLSVNVFRKIILHQSYFLITKVSSIMFTDSDLEGHLHRGNVVKVSFLV